MATRPDPYVGPETTFVGQVHAGQFYNQVPTEVFLNGTWRFSPRKTFADAEAELCALLAAVPTPPEIRCDLHAFQVRPSYQLAEQEPLVLAVQDAYLATTGNPLPLAGARAVCDTPILIREGGIPCVSHGPVTHGAHGEPEFICGEDQVRTAAVYLRTLERFWRAAG